MAFDPTLPANNSPIVSEELRNQFQGLKDELDAKVSIGTLNDTIANETAGTCLGRSTLGLTISNPPTQAQVQAIADKLDEIIIALQRI